MAPTINLPQFSNFSTSSTWMLAFVGTTAAIYIIKCYYNLVIRLAEVQYDRLRATDVHHTQFFRNQSGDEKREILPVRNKVSAKTNKVTQWDAWINHRLKSHNMNSLIPTIIERASAFGTKLSEIAETGNFFCLDLTAMPFTLDMTCTTILDSKLANFNSSSTSHETFLDLLRVQANWSRRVPHTSDFLTTQKIRTLLSDLVFTRYNALLDTKQTNEPTSLLDFILYSYIREEGYNASLDLSFRKAAAKHLQSIAIMQSRMPELLATVFDLLSNDADPLARLRAEHESVFGSSLTNLTQTVIQDPTSWHKLVYTTAVVKETLRLEYPEKFSMGRIASLDETVRCCPSECLMLEMLRRDVEVKGAKGGWIMEKDFLPERWLVGEGHRLWPGEEAWRVDNNMEGLLLNMTVLLVMLVRNFDIQPVTGLLGVVDVERGLYGDELINLGGEEDGIPFRVTKRKQMEDGYYVSQL